MKLAHGHHAEFLVLKKEERLKKKKRKRKDGVMQKGLSSPSLVFCQQAIGPLAARMTGKFSPELHSHTHF